MDAPACPQNFSAKQLARVALQQEARITKSGSSKKFLDLAAPMEGRVRLVVKHLMFGVSVRFPLLSNKAKRIVADSLDTAYRLAHKDGAVGELRLIERKLKVVL